MYDRAPAIDQVQNYLSGLSLIGQGTFGWMLTDAQGQQLVTGAGLVDGPATQVSCTRSELHGFAAPLEYVYQLARYYSMNPKGLYDSECDSQCANTPSSIQTTAAITI
jgi:hypothetical protein